MSAAKNTTPAVTCPKCEQGRVLQHSHILGGVCFLCGGRGRCSQEAAQGWLWKQSEARGTVTDFGAPPAVNTKMVDLDGQMCRIGRMADGMFWVESGGEDGDLPDYNRFAVRNGVVVMVPFTDRAERYVPGLRAMLQDALKR